LDESASRGKGSDVGNENVHEDKFENICKRNVKTHCPDDGIKTQSICQKIQDQKDYKTDDELLGGDDFRKMQLSTPKGTMYEIQCPQGYCEKKRRKAQISVYPPGNTDREMAAAVLYYV
jgi:hypothetical protein